MAHQLQDLVVHCVGLDVVEEPLDVDDDVAEPVAHRVALVVEQDRRLGPGDEGTLQRREDRRVTW